MHIKNIHCAIEYLSEYGKCMAEAGATSKGNVNIGDMGQIVDMIKDLAEAEYYARLAKCLEKDEETGEQEKRTAELMRDIDRASHQRLYFSEPMKTDEGKYEKALREHWKVTKEHAAGTPEDKQATMRSAEAVLNIMFDDIDKMVEDASPELRNMIKAKGTSRIARIS